MSLVTHPRFLLFAIASVVLSLSACILALLGADVYVHHRFEYVAGVNIRGYRGAVAGRKRPHQVRIVTLGGSTVLNWGQPFEESFPAQLDIALNKSSAASARPFSVVNLGFSTEGAFTFRYTLADYDYLGPDIALLYEGYNDLSVPNLKMVRHESAVFRWTGYFPMLPMVAQEKAMQLRSGDIHEAYRGRVVFRPSAVARTKAALLEASVSIVKSLEASAATSHPDTPLVTDVRGDCSPPWRFYCQSIGAAVDSALARHSAAMVVTQPYLNDLHRDQQRELREMLRRRYGVNPLVMYVDLGNAVDLADPSLCWDGMHLLAEGNRRIARALTPAVQQMVQSPAFQRGKGLSDNN